MTILFVQFPDDFEQRYDEYKTRLLGVQKTDKKEVADTINAQQQKELDVYDLGFDRNLYRKEVNEENQRAFALQRDEFRKDQIFKRKIEILEAKKNRLQTDDESPSLKQKTKFNSMIGLLNYGDITHRFHRGIRGEKIRLSLFKKLWDKRRYIKNGIEKKKGESLTPEFLAVQLNIASDVSVFNRNKKIKEKFFGIIKGINKILYEKGFPAKIERKNGIQLVITEK